MAFLDDLQKATQLFDQGMTKLATTNAFNKANQQLAELNQTAISEAEKAAEINKLSQGLAQDLLQAGASTGQVQQAFQAFSPVKPQTGAELIARGAVEEGMQRQFQQTQVETDRQKELLAFRAGLQGQQDKQKSLADLGGKINKSVEAFANQKVNKAQLEAIPTYQSLTDTLNTGNLDAAFLNTATKQLAKTVEGGRLTDQDFELARVNQDLMSKFNRVFKRITTGEGIPKDFEELQEFGRVMQAATARRLNKSADRFARSRAKTIGADPDVLAEQIKAQTGIPTLRTSSQGAGGQTDMNTGGLPTLVFQNLPSNLQQGVKAAAAQPNNPKAQQFLERLKKKFNVQTGSTEGSF